MMRITRLAPEFIKAPVRSYLRRSAIKNALMMLGDGVTDERVHGFHKAWGSGGFSADADYMLRLARLLDKTKGPVLECGSGGTTLLANEIGLLRGFNTYSLEQEREWVKTMDGMMAEKCATKVLFAPLERLRDHYFYDTGRQYLPKHFSLIICDGPYIDVSLGEPYYSGWRYGILPWLGRAERTWDVLLLDDVNDKRAEAVLDRWVREFGVKVDIIKSTDGECATVRR